MRAQVAAANGAAGADEIRFSFSGTPIVLTSGEIAVTEALTISGNGATNTIIDGNANSRIFNVTAAVPLSIDGVTIRNGRANGGGGVNSNGAVTITNSIVSGNTSTGDGGGVRSVGDLTITNSTVSGNTADSAGGGVYSAGAVTITNSTVSGNTAIFSAGGGVYSAGALTITNSTVSGNNNTSLGFGGGGVFSVGAVTITNSTVSGNTSTNGGGGVAGNAITIINSTVSGNTADGGGGGVAGNAITIINSTVSGNTANFDGGGVYNAVAATITNSTVSGNTSTRDGGGIASNGAVTLTNSTVSGNTAIRNGGGVYINNGGTITNSTIANNIADADNDGIGNGGGIFRNAGIVTIANSIIASNFDTPNNTGAGAINPDVSGIFTDNGNNLIGDTTGSTNFTVSTLLGTAANRLNPQLTPLANNGGLTQTHALLPNSPALNAGNNSFAVVNDQRGLPRISNGTVDIGAFEFQVAVTTAPVAVTPTNSTGFGGVFPSRENLDKLSSKLEDQNLELSFTQVLCFDDSLEITQQTYIPNCKDRYRKLPK